MSEQAKCTLCAGLPSSGFYTGCMFKDGHDCNGWQCDGSGNLTRKTADDDACACGGGKISGHDAMCPERA